MKLEVINLPVADVDRAKRFYQKLGWRMDGDFTEARVPGPDPGGRSYFTWASFSDPDGNGWLLQEIKTRLPGREWT